jgi:hypothetical protein
MAFDFITLLRRLAICAGVVLFLVVLILASMYVGGTFGFIWGFLTYMSPAIVGLLYLMGLKG